MATDIEGGVEVDKPEQTVEDPAASSSCLGKWGVRILKYGTLALLVYELPYFLYGVFVLFVVLPTWMGKKLLNFFRWNPHPNLPDVSDYDSEDEIEGDDKIAGMYNKAREGRGKIRKMFSSYSLLTRATILSLTWLMMSLFITDLKGVEIQGSPMWKWGLLAVTFTAGFSLALNFLFPKVTKRSKSKLGKTIYYYAETMERSMAVTAHFCLLMLTWVLYFRTSHGLNQDATPNHWVFEYVTWSFVSLFIGSLLWTLKDFLMAKWRADAIYRRLTRRIFIASLKYLFIGMCAAGFREPRLIQRLLDCYGITKQHQQQEDDADTIKYSFKLGIISQKMGLVHLNLVNQILTSLVDIMSPLLDRESEEEEVVRWFHKQFKDNHPTEMCTQDSLQKLFDTSCPDDENDCGKDKILANVLYELLREEYSSAHFTFHDFTRWMVDAHKDCKNMGRTLADASEMVNCLDRFLSCIIIVIVTLLWLLVTGVSSTTVLVTFGAPILALTFMFGDTAKIFFQGIIFCFCTHPFDVGDRCILHGTELEVKNVSILTTTFIKIGSKEKKLYPNTVLANEAIVNLGWQPDSRDSLVLTLDSSTNIKILETKIKEFMTKKTLLYNEDSWEVMVKEVGDITRVEIHFTHVLTIHDLSHNQCFKKKSKQKSYFMKKLNKYIKESRREQVYPSKCDAPVTANEIQEFND